MAKIQRVKQEIFAQNAGSQQITSFGTAKTDTPVYTKNVAQIQNTNYLYGWSAGLLPDKAPWQEDMNALFYAITTQLAYLFQEGMPEYDVNTTYSAGALVKSSNTQGQLTIYKSLVDENIGNPLTSESYWSIFQSESAVGTATYEIGLPQPTFSNTLLSNEIWLEGQTVSRTTYSKLFEIYGTTYGAGDGSTTFNLPDCRNRVLWGSTSFGYINAGLPNITGTFGGVRDVAAAPTGAFYRTGWSASPGAGRDTQAIGFEASRSNGIYGNSNTVQPPAIKCRVKTRHI